MARDGDRQREKREIEGDTERKRRERQAKRKNRGIDTVIERGREIKR